MKAVRTALFLLVMCTGITSAGIIVSGFTTEVAQSQVEYGTIIERGNFDKSQQAYPYIIKLDSGKEIGWYSRTMYKVGTQAIVTSSDTGEEVEILG